MTKTAFIGDVHGCIAELEALLEKLALKRSDDVVFVGDMINKGPDSAAVLRKVRALKARAVLGNHEAHYLHRRALPKSELKAEQRKLLESFSDEDFAFLEALPPFLRLPTLKVIVVHGGVVPGLALEKHSTELLLNLRSIDDQGQPSKKLEGGRPWAGFWQGPEFVIFGHDARRGLQRHPHAIGLDTGCVYGGALSAYVLPEGKVVSVAAKKRYVEPGG